jgi:KaiC/GvpD/RAD55 family RecA-like ATPase
LAKLDCTTLITSETIGEAPIDITSRDGSLSRHGVEEFILDGVVSFHNSGLGGEGDRAIRVVKMRRTNHTKGPNAMSISDKGIRVLGKEKSYR